MILRVSIIILVTILLAVAALTVRASFGSGTAPAATPTRAAGICTTRPVPGEKDVYAFLDARNQPCLP